MRAKALTALFQTRGRGVWVPAYAGTTDVSLPRPPQPVAHPAHHGDARGRLLTGSRSIFEPRRLVRRDRIDTDRAGINDAFVPVLDHGRDSGSARYVGCVRLDEARRAFDHR